MSQLTDALYRILDSDAAWWPLADLRPTPETPWTAEHMRRLVRDRRWRLANAGLVLAILVNTLAIAFMWPISTATAVVLFLVQCLGVAAFMLAAGVLTQALWNRRARRLQQQ